MGHYRRAVCFLEGDDPDGQSIRDLWMEISKLLYLEEGSCLAWLQVFLAGAAFVWNHHQFITCSPEEGESEVVGVCAYWGCSGHRSPTRCSRCGTVVLYGR